MRILFVCSGNTCRSPLAEAIARQLAADRGLHDVTVASAGISAWEGAPASDGSLLVAMERGLDLSAHRARLLDRAMVDDAELILCMGPQHRDAAVATGGEGKAFLLTEWASRGEDARGVSDPYGGDLAGYRRAADDIAAALEKVFDRVVAEREGGGS